MVDIMGQGMDTTGMRLFIYKINLQPRHDDNNCCDFVFPLIYKILVWAGDVKYRAYTLQLLGIN